MLEQFLKKLIYGFLQDIIEDFSENEIELSKWRGSLELKNLNIKKDYLTDLGVKIGFPLVKESAIIEKLQLSIPWTKIRSEPIIIKIKGIKVVCRTSGQYSQVFYEKRLAAKKYQLLQKLIKQIEMDILKSKSEKFNVKGEYNQNIYDEDEDEDSKIQDNYEQKGNNEGNFIKKKMSAYKSYLSQIKEIILQNIRIEIEDLDLKLVDESIATQDSFMQIGIAFQKLLISPANSEFQPTFINPEQIKKDQKKYQIYKLTGFEIFATQNIFLDFDKQYILHPINIDIQKMKNNNKEELQTIPQKSTKIIISSVKVELFEKHFKHIRNILKYKNWHCEMGPTLYLRPDYNEQIQGNAKKWLNYLFKSLHARVNMRRYQNQNTMTIINLIKSYIQVYKEKLEFELEQKMTVQQFTQANTQLNQLHKQQYQDLNVNPKKIDINDIEKSIEEIEKQLFIYPILPQDILVYRDIAKHQIRKEQSEKFKNLLKLKKSNKQKQLHEKQQAKSMLQKALQQEKIKNIFGWFTSKIRRKSSISSVSSANGNINAEEQIIQLSEEEEQEELLKQEFNQFIESYTEGWSQKITKEQMKGKNYIKNKLSVEFQDSINISLMIMNTTTKHHGSQRNNSGNQMGSKQNFTQPTTQFMNKQNTLNTQQETVHSHPQSQKHHRDEFQESNFELLHLRINISQCFKISTNVNSMIRFVISEFDCRHTINPSEVFQNTLSNLDRDVQKPTLSLKLIRQKNSATNQVSYRFSLNVASHQFILTDVFFSSVMSFFSMKQKSRSFLEDFNVKTKQVKKKIDLYLAEQIRNIFGHKILFDKIDVKCGKLLFLFPEKFSDIKKPLIEFAIESFFVSNKPIDITKIKSILEKDRAKHRLIKEQDFNNLDISNLNKQNLDNLTESHINTEQSLYKSCKEDLMQSFANGQSYMTYRTDQFHSVLEVNPAFNQSKIDNFDELNAYAQEAQSDGGDSDHRSERHTNNFHNNSFGNNTEYKDCFNDFQSMKIMKKEEIESRIIKRLLEKGYFQIYSNKNSMLNESKFDNLQINCMVSNVTTHFCQNGLESANLQKLKILEDFFIETHLKRAFKHQQLNENELQELNQPTTARSKSQENKLNEIPVIISENKPERKLAKKRQTVSLDDFQNQMITDFFEKDNFISKVQLAVDVTINQLALNLYLEIHDNLTKILKQFNKVFVNKQNQVIENLNDVNPVYTYDPYLNPHNLNAFQKNQIEEEKNGENESSQSGQIYKSAIGSPLEIHQNEDTLFQTLPNRLNTTQLTYRDEEFFDAVEDFSQFFKHQSQIYQQPPIFNYERQHQPVQFHDGLQQNNKQDHGFQSGNGIKYSTEEMKKKMDIIRQARNQSYILQLHSQYLKEKMNKKYSSKLYQSDQNDDGNFDEQYDRQNEYFEQIKGGKEKQQNSEDDEYNRLSESSQESVQHLSLRDLITLDFTLNLNQFRIYVRSSSKKNDQEDKQNQYKQDQQGKAKILFPKKTSALIVSSIKLQVTFLPAYSQSNNDESAREDKEEDVKSINLDPQQNFQQQILLVQNNNFVQSENYFEKSNRKKSFCSVTNTKNKVNHVIQMDIKIDEVNITIYKIEKILNIMKANSESSNSNKDSTQDQQNTQKQDGEDSAKAAELKDQTIFNNLKTILLIKDSEVNISFGLNKGSLKFQDSRKQIKEFNEFVEFCVEDVKLENDLLVPIKFDFSELRYIEQLANIMNYVQYKIQLGWKFNATYTNMSNKQVEPFVEDMNINLQLIQQNYKKDIIYECQNDIQVNFHPALIDNIFILQQSFMKINKNKTKHKLLSQKKLKEQQTDYQYEISNQTGILFGIQFSCQVTLKYKKSCNSGNNQDQKIKKNQTIEMRANDEYLIGFQRSEKEKNQKINKENKQKYMSSHEIKVIINKKTTTIDLLQNSKDTYIKIKGDFYIVCQPITYNDRKIVFRSNIKLTNLTHFNFNFLFSHHEQSVKQTTNAKQNKRVQQVNNHIEVQMNKLSEKYAPFQLFQMKYLQIKDQNIDIYSPVCFFKDYIQNFIPIMANAYTSFDGVPSTNIINSSQQVDENNQNESMQQSYVIIRRLRNESNLQAQTAAANGFQNAKLLATEMREIQIVIQYPVLIHNLNPLPIDISFLYPKQFDNASDIIVEKTFKVANLNHNVIPEMAEQIDQEDEIIDQNDDDDAVWNKKFKQNKHKITLAAGQSSYLSIFNTFLMCKVSLDLQNFSQFKPLEIFDSKTIKTYWDFIMTSQLYLEQQYKLDSEGAQQKKNLQKNSEGFPKQTSLEPDFDQHGDLFYDDSSDEEDYENYNQDSNLSILKASTSSQLLTQQSQNEIMHQYMINQLQKNPFIEPIVKQKTLQLLNKDGQQMNLVFDIKYSYEGMLEITMKSQYWFLNETEIALNLQIKENRYLYPKIPLMQKNLENSTQLKVPYSYNQQIGSVQQSTNSIRGQANFVSSQQLHVNTPREDFRKKDKRGAENFNSQASGKKSPMQKNKLQSAEKLNEMKNIFFQSDQQPHIRQFDDGTGQGEQQAQQINHNNGDLDMRSIQSAYFGINSNNFSIEKIEELFKTQSQNIQLFTGNFSSEKQFRFEIPQDEIESLLQLQPYNEKNNEESNSQEHGYSTDFLILDQKNVNINFKHLKYLTMQVSQVLLPEKFKDIKFFILTPLFIIKNSSIHSLSVNQFISSTQSIESSLSPNQTRQLIYDQVRYPFVQLKPAHNFSLWSQKFPIDKPTQFIIKINHINKSNSFILLRITISRESSINLITIEDTNEYPPFKIVNLTNEELAVSQKNFQGQSLFVKMQSDPKDMYFNMDYDEKLIDHFLKNFSPFGWDDPFGEETMIISTMDALLCSLTKKEFQEKNFTKIIRQFDEDIVIKIFQDKEYPKTRIILILYERNQKLFDEYKFEENIYQNLTFHLNLHKIGISIVDSHPREIIYFQMDQISINLKQLNKRFEVQIEVQDVQGDYQASKPLPTPFLVTKKNLSKDRSDKLIKKKNKTDPALLVEDNANINSSQQSQSSFFSKMYQKLSGFLKKAPTEKKKIQQEEDLKNIAQQVANANKQKLNNQNENQTEDRLTTQNQVASECATPATNTIKSALNQQSITSAFIKSQQSTRNNKYKSFFKLNYIQQYYQSTKTNHVEKLKLELQPIEINIDGGLIHRLIQFVNEIKMLLQKHPKNNNGVSGKESQDEIQLQSMNKLFIASPLQKQVKYMQKKQDKILHFMIEKFDILPISVDIKFSNLHTSNINMDSSSMQYFIMILLNLIGSNKFFFERFNDENHLYSLSNLMRKIINHYSSSIENQLFNIIVNANLIGNPGQLFKEIGFALVDFINTVFDEVHRSEEVLLTQEKFYQSAFKSGYLFTKRVAHAFKSSAQIISKSIISELFDHVDEHQSISNTQKKDFLLQMQSKSNMVTDKNQTQKELIADINQLKNFKGSFVNLFHTAFLFPLSTPYSLNSVMVKKLQKLDQKKIKSLHSILRVKRYPRAVKKINSTYCLEKYDEKRSLGKLFFEAFDLMEFGDFESTIMEQYQLQPKKIWFITKERFIIIDEEQLKILFNVAKQDVSYLGVEKNILRFKYCLDTQENQKHQTISMKVLNLEVASFEVNFNQDQTNLINKTYNSAFEYKNYLNSHIPFKTLDENQGGNLKLLKNQNANYNIQE